MTLPSALVDSSETAHTMAERLGISDGDPEAFKQFDVKNEARIFSFENLPSHGTEPWFRLMCEFSSLYLPRLVQSILFLFTSSSPLTPLFILKALGHLLPLPFAATYFRTHPEEVRKLVLAQMEYISSWEVEPTSDRPYHLSPSSTLFESHTRVLHDLLFLSTLCSSSSVAEGFFVPSYTLRFNTIATLRAHRRLFPPPNDPSLTQTMREDTEQSRRVIAFIQEDRPWRESCVGWEVRENKESKGSTRGWPWDGCAMRHAGGCVASTGTGREFMVCAKCRSVRYCSPKQFISELTGNSLTRNISASSFLSDTIAGGDFRELRCVPTAAFL